MIFFLSCDIIDKKCTESTQKKEEIYMKKRSLVSGIVAMAMAASVFTGAGVAGVNFVSANEVATPSAVTSGASVSGPAVTATPSAVTTDTAVTTKPAVTTPSAVKKPAKVTKVKTTRKSAKVAVVTWKKIKGVAGYQVKYSTKKSLKSAKTVTVKKNTAKATIKGLKKNKVYYVKVRAYKKNSKKKNVYGTYSKVVKVAAKAKAKKK